MLCYPIASKFPEIRTKGPLKSWPIHPQTMTVLDSFERPRISLDYPLLAKREGVAALDLQPAYTHP